MSRSVSLSIPVGISKGVGKGSATEDNFQLPSAPHSALKQNTTLTRLRDTVVANNHSTPHCSIIQGRDEDASELHNQELHSIYLRPHCSKPRISSSHLMEARGAAFLVTYGLA